MLKILGTQKRSVEVKDEPFKVMETCRPQDASEKFNKKSLSFVSAYAWVVMIVTEEKQRRCLE